MLAIYIEGKNGKILILVNVWRRSYLFSTQCLVENYLFAGPFKLSQTCSREGMGVGHYGNIITTQSAYYFDNLIFSIILQLTKIKRFFEKGFELHLIIQHVFL